MRKGDLQPRVVYLIRDGLLMLLESLSPPGSKESSLSKYTMSRAERQSSPSVNSCRWAALPPQ
jgi:hypothetical protein